jgi:hypothetical protein
MLDQLILFPIRQSKRTKGRVGPTFPMLSEFIEELKEIRRIKKDSRKVFIQICEPFNPKQDYIWIVTTRDKDFPIIKGFYSETQPGFSRVLEVASNVRRKEITEDQG